jgi:RHS repeat-associated protein
MRADYTYDCTDRRIAKKVLWKAGALDPDDPGSTLRTSRTQTIIYVDKTFEVRDHDQPTKYVFIGATRIASITGSLSTNARIQRFRLYPGWNLLSLAVGVTNALQQILLAPTGTNGPGAIQAVFQWNSTNGTYAPVASAQALPAGTVLWLQAATHCSLAIIGPYREPVDRQLNLPGDYIPSAGLEAWSLQLSPALSGWMYQAASNQWLDWLASDLSLPTNPPPVLPPGSAIYVRGDQPSELEVPSPALRVRYYHQDHLGSSSVVTDADGAIIEESAFFPFGTARNDYLPRRIHEPYQFTQKERDVESGLHYFEARFLAGNLSRFTRPDPKYASPDVLSKDEFTDFLLNPQKLNLYTYALNNPLKYTDPTGLGPLDWIQENVWIPFKDPVSQLDGWRTVGNVGAGVGFVAGALTCETGVGCALAAVSLDHLQSDVRGTRPLGAQGLGYLSGSDRFGDISYAVVQLGLGGGATALKVASVVSKARTARAAAAAVSSLEAEAEAASVAESVPKAWPKTIYEPPIRTPTLPGVTAPREFNYTAVRAAELAERRAAALLQTINSTPKSAWTMATIQATSDFRATLPTIEAQQENLRKIYEAAETLFGPGP